MFDVVVVPLDETPHTERVVPLAKEEAARHGARIVLVHVVPRPELPAEVGRRGGPTPIETRYPDAQRDVLVERAQQYLEDVQRRYDLPEATERVITIGEPARRVMAVLGQYENPLVIVTSGEPTAQNPRPPVSTLPLRLMVEGRWPVLALRPNRNELADPPAMGGWRAPKFQRRDDEFFEPVTPESDGAE